MVLAVLFCVTLKNAVLHDLSKMQRRTHAACDLPVEQYHPCVLLSQHSVVVKHVTVLGKEIVFDLAAELPTVT